MRKVKYVEEQNMTLGEKIRIARRKCGLSQEQLAERMSVSRSAIAKWETDKGLPDVGNLKVLARLLNVSVDHLLDEGEATEDLVIREPYHLAAYGRGCKKVKKDRVVRERFPEAKIYTLFGRQEIMDMEILADQGPDCRTAGQDLTKNTDKAFYLVEKEDGQYHVTVTDAFLEIRLLEQPLEGNAFSLDGWNYIKYNFEIGG